MFFVATEKEGQKRRTKTFDRSDYGPLTFMA